MSIVINGGILALVHDNDAACLLHTEHILHGTGNGNVEHETRSNGSTGLTDLAAVGQPAVVDERTGGSNLTVEEGCKLLKHLQIVRGLDATAAGDDYIAVSDIDVDILIGNKLDDLIVRIGFDLDGFLDDLALCIRIGIEGGEHLGMHGGHLGTLLQNDNVRKNLSAVSGSGLVKDAVLVIAEVNSVGGKTGVKSDHEPGGEVAAKRSCTVEENGGLVLLDKLGQSGLIGSCAVAGKSRIVDHDDLVGAAGDKLGCKRIHVIAEQNGDYLFLVVLLELMCFCKQLENSVLYNTVFLFGKHPYAFVIFLCHECSPP